MAEEHTDSLTKRAKNDLRRAEKERKRQKEIRMKKRKKAVPWIIFIGITIGGTGWLIATADKTRVERPGQEIPIVSRDHINVGDPHEPYNSNPPTSGPHAEASLWGIKDGEIPDENAIHNLEHGGIWISYKDLDEASVDTLKKIAERNSGSVILSPRSANDSKIAVASWGRLMKLDTVDEEKINEFIKRNKNKSPERLAR